MDIIITSPNTANKNGNICRNNPICLGHRNIYKYNIAGHIHCHECINQPIINDNLLFSTLLCANNLTLNNWTIQQVKPRLD